MSEAVQGIRLTITKGFASPTSVDVWQPEATIGRSPDANLRFDPQRDTASARGMHARLLWRENAWWIECLHERGLGTVDGDRVTGRIAKGDRIRVVTPATFEVGSGGPRFEVVSLAGTIPATEVEPVGDVPVGRIPQSTLTHVRSTRKRTLLLAAGVCLIAVIGTVVAVQLTRSGRQVGERIDVVRTEAAEETQRVVADLMAMKGDLGELAEKTEDRLGAALRAASQSVWLVGLVDEHGVFTNVGTAWTCSANKLATNAHVAVALRERLGSSGTRIVARRSLSDDVASLEILSTMHVHPAYEQWTRRFQDQFFSGPGGTLRAVRFISPGDVAVLDVTAGDPGPPLTLASSDASIDSLKPGAAVGYVGYPTENVVGFPTLLSPTGRITALTNYFFESAPNDALLVHHDAVATGGASGSPLITEDGEVVAVVSGGNIVAVGTPSGSSQRVPIGLNFAQHIRLLHELLEGTAADHQRRRDPLWQEALERLTLSPEHLLAWLVHERGLPADRIELVDQQVLELAGSGPAHAKIMQLELESGASYVILAVAHGRDDIDLIAIDAGRNELARDDAIDWHPVISLGSSTSSREIAVAVVASGDLPSNRAVLTMRIVKVLGP